MSDEIQWQKINPDLLLPLQEAVKLLPNVRPAAVRDQLGEAMYFASRSPGDSVRIGKLEVSRAELAELFICDKRLRPRASPDGAGLLLRLYAADAFEPKDARLGKGPTDELERYAAARPSQLSPWRRPARRVGARGHTGSEGQPANSAVQHRPTTETYPAAGAPGNRIIRRG